MFIDTTLGVLLQLNFVNITLFSIFLLCLIYPYLNILLLYTTFRIAVKILLVA